jgi:hypothetical protein
MKNLFFITLLLSFTCCYSQTSKTTKDFISIYKQALDSIKGRTDSIYYSGSQTIMVLKKINPGVVLFKVLKNTPLAAITAKALSVKEYSYTDKLVKNARFCFVEITYKSSAEAATWYKKIKKIALEKNGIPGLTYTNDFIINKKNKIYWFNSNCMYSGDIHFQLSFAIFNLYNPEFNECVVCDCGKVICQEIYPL